MRTEIRIVALLILGLLSCTDNKLENVSGDYYDWTITGQPERPWVRDYNKTLITKFFLCSRDGNGDVDQVYLTFEQALEVIKKLDGITMGIPKVVYLVGWQFNGHDSKYPSWGEVNEYLKREQDSTALQSLKWLINRAREHNTTISLHLNMIDAFEDSPLWDTYLQEDIIAKDSTGQPIPGEVFWDMQSYQLSYAREWELGLAQKRIDGLLEMLPELVEGGTIHIDAFHSMRPSGVGETISPYLGIPMEEEIAAQRKIFRYWRDKGMDVTCEAGMYWLRKDPFLGLQAASWHNTAQNFLKEDWMGKPSGFEELPVQLSAFTPMQCEQEVMRDPDSLSGLIEQVATRLVPWYIDRNTPKNEIPSWYTVTDSLVVAPVRWQAATLIAYSPSDPVVHTLTMGDNAVEKWKKVEVAELGLNGPVARDTLVADNGNLVLQLDPGSVWVLKGIN
jgi:hypothetical protein